VKDLEKYIFSQIGNMDIGPKELACGNKWRIEEFIFDGTHPTP
jgi:choline/ethanolamine kinase